MSTKDNILGKILVCCFCSGTACQTAQLYDCWTAVESYGLCVLNCQGCCWALCAPICHGCKCGDTDAAVDHLSKALRHCAFCCLLYCVSPCDGCYNCICYQKQNCTEGVSSFRDVTKHTMWLGGKIKDFLNLTTSNQPRNTYDSFKP